MILIQALGFLLGICSFEFFVAKLTFTISLMLIIAIICIYLKIRWKILLLILWALIGILWIHILVEKNKNKFWPKQLEGKLVQVEGVFVDKSLDAKERSKEIYYFIVNKVQYNDIFYNKLKLKVKLYSTNFNNEFEIGDVWRLNVKLKRPRNFFNPNFYDIEKQYYIEKIKAIGYINTKKRNIFLKREKYSKLLNIFRDYIKKTLKSVIKNKELLGLVLAVVLADKSLLSFEFVELCKKTGTSHLLVVSGLHVGFVFAVGFIISVFLWKVFYKNINIPKKIFASTGGILFSASYVLLAGFKVSCVRALLMVIMGSLGVILRRNFSNLNILFWALFVILLLNPFVVLHSGFWLSFWGVFLLIAFSKTFTFGTCQNNNYLYNKLKIYMRPHFVIFIGMIIINVYYFGKVSLISPLCNMIAIPLVSFGIIAPSIICTFMALIFPKISIIIFNLIDYVYYFFVSFLKVFMLIKTNLFYDYEKIFYFYNVTKLSWFLAIVGTLLLLLPKKVPGKILAIFCFLGVLFPKTNSKIDYGQVIFTTLDVGQGLANVIETQNHVFLYDLGPKFSLNFNAGDRIVYPFLCSKNIKIIDKVIVSHPDLDHCGGLDGIVSKINVGNFYTSEPKYFKKNKKVKFLSCYAGKSWDVDGVHFEFFHPSFLLSKNKNENSCVLSIQTKDKKILLTGDIGVKTENKLCAKYKSKLKADILVASHHGSKHSSSINFIKQVDPEYVIISAGYLNQFGHPSKKILNRYKNLNVKVLSTIDNGAISFKLDAKNMIVQPKCYKLKALKYWNFEYFENHNNFDKFNSLNFKHKCLCS